MLWSLQFMCYFMKRIDVKPINFSMILIKSFFFRYWIVQFYMGRINELWHLFLDLVGPRHLWPRDIPKYFWGVTDRGTGTLNYKERFRVAVFCYINGISVDIFMEWCYLLYTTSER